MAQPAKSLKNRLRIRIIQRLLRLPGVRVIDSAGPASPCINVCALDAGRRCTGCGRTIDEIAGWGGMSASERWAVIARLESARAAEACAMSAAGAAAR
jgi:uncharacterized protein